MKHYRKYNLPFYRLVSLVEKEDNCRLFLHFSWRVLKRIRKRWTTPEAWGWSPKPLLHHFNDFWQGDIPKVLCLSSCTDRPTHNLFGLFPLHLSQKQLKKYEDYKSCLFQQRSLFFTFATATQMDLNKTDKTSTEKQPSSNKCDFHTSLFHNDPLRQILLLLKLIRLKTVLILQKNVTFLTTALLDVKTYL